jgi:hypothetical protein
MPEREMTAIREEMRNSFSSYLGMQMPRVGTPLYASDRVIGRVTAADPTTGEVTVEITVDLPEPIPYVSVSVSVNPDGVTLLPQPAEPLVKPELAGFTDLWTPMFHACELAKLNVDPLEARMI